jgi:DNA modification methylase
MMTDIALDTIHCMDALTLLRSLPDNFIHCIVTSPPYWGLRDYGVAGQIGLEATLQEYVQALTVIFREARRVLRDDGTFWLNLGDAYASSPSGNMASSGLEGGKTTQLKFRDATKHKHVPQGLKPKDLMMIPARVAIALQDDGWYLRQDNIWHKPNPMPESVKDRTTTAHEYVFHFSKSERYWYDADAISETAIEGTDLGILRTKIEAVSDKITWHAQSIKQRQTAGVDSRTAGNGKRNRRSVWTIPSQPFAAAHFATFPEALPRICILAGCPKGGIVYDPFMGAGTTALVAQKLGRRYLGSELNPDYVDLANHRLQNRINEYQAKANGKPHTLFMFEDD